MMILHMYLVLLFHNNHLLFHEMRSASDGTVPKFPKLCQLSLAGDKDGLLIVSVVTEKKFIVVIYFAANPFREVWYTMPCTRCYLTTVQLPTKKQHIYYERDSCRPGSMVTMHVSMITSTQSTTTFTITHDTFWQHAPKRDMCNCPKNRH